VAVISEELEERICNEDHQHTQHSDHYEMQLFVIEIPSALVIQTENVIVNLSDKVDYSVNPFLDI
jgi:hypothetical protein